MILTLGDSVCWGQGLLEEHKFDFLFARSKGLQFKRAAHSGAIIGTAGDSSAEVEDGEVPVGTPSVWQQMLAQKDWSQVEIVLLNGGINDVSLTRILNPVVTTAQLTLLVDQFCGKAMRELLLATAGKLAVPGARIAVIGYFPIFSSQSGATELQFRALLELHGLASSSVIASEAFSLEHVVPKVGNNSLTFWQRSNKALQDAVDAANASLGKNVCVFVKLPFTEANALWAPESLLWELSLLLAAEDEVSSSRGHTCKLLYDDLFHIPKLLQCERASVGHPKVEGAARIAETIAAAL